MVKQPLTNRQIIVLQFIRQFMTDNGYAPTIREIAEGLGLCSTGNIHAHIKALEDKGYIKRKEMSPRAIKVI